MSKRSKYTAEEKYQIIKAYEDGVGSTREIISRYQISRFAFYDWRYKYAKYGIDGLRESKNWKEYSQELKEHAIKDYLSGEYSPIEISQKYGISSKSTLLNWVKKYNCHREIKATVKGLGHSMTKGRATSWKERIEIVLFCITHNNDYQQTAEIHQVSYQQVYQWVKKYESGGDDALKDRRGRKKDEDELTADDKLKIEMKKLKADNERLRAENAFLKKLEELERRRF
jgi:Transposase and inactivated derivatives